MFNSLEDYDVSDREIDRQTGRHHNQTYRPPFTLEKALILFILDDFFQKYSWVVRNNSCKSPENNEGCCQFVAYNLCWPGRHFIHFHVVRVKSYL